MMTMKSRVSPLPRASARANASLRATPLNVVPRSATPLSATSLSAARRFELGRVPCRRRERRRSGQALLLAVLIMLLAALLSAGFLAVLSGNLNQTARIGDKTRAVEASRAGVEFANAQLTYSAGGDQWRPTDVSPVPTNAGALAAYYSQLDQVQGWASQGYAKFPDPNQPIGNAPKFLLKVEEVPTDPAANGYDAEHAGELKITSIGLSDDDPNVFNRTVAYKKGRKQSPWAQAFRSISNWDFDRNAVPAAKSASVTTVGADTQVTLQDPAQTPGFIGFAGLQQQTPFNVVIYNPNGAPTRGAVVKDVGTNTLTLQGTVTPILPNARVELAAAIGTASTFDLGNSGTPTQFPNTDQPNGIRANGGVWLQGAIELTNLQKSGTKIFNSGYLAVTQASTIPGNFTVNVPTPPQGNTGSDVVQGGFIAPSSSGSFPGAFTTASGVSKLDLIRDGASRIGNTTTVGLTYTTPGSRDVEPYKPAQINSKGNLGRYRDLARSVAAGVYVDNPDDIEKVGGAGAEMTQKQLMQMWLSPTGATEDFARQKVAAPASITATDKSLEEQHVRGWVGNDEFLARGALVELVPGGGPGAGPQPYIRVTLDSRADNRAATANTAADIKRATGPVASKQWTAAPPGTNPYIRQFAWPTNGTLFAEGNVRIRGQVTGAPNSLTVVSGGNLYIEGSVGVDTAYDPTATDATNGARKKLMLLARKNVVVNPTRLALGHVDVETTAPQGAGAAATAQLISIPVSSVTGFKLGDVIETYSFSPNTPNDRTLGVRGIVTDITNTALAVRILAPRRAPNGQPISVADGSTVATVVSDGLSADPATATAPKTAVASATKAFSRRVLLQNINTFPNLRLALDHYGDYKKAFTVETKADGVDPATGAVLGKPDGLQVFLSNRRSAPPAAPFAPATNQVTALEKVVRGEYNAPVGPPDNFFPPAPTPPYTLATLKTAMDASTHLQVIPPAGWRYDTTIEALTPATADPAPATTLAPATPDTLPFHFLAGVGLRYDPALSATINPADPNTWRSTDIGPDNQPYSIPLATSVSVLRNNQAVSLSPANQFIANLTPGVDLQYLGFNPQYGSATAVPPQPAIEDRLSVDRSFYQTDAKYSSLDSRRLYGLTGLTAFNTNDVLTFGQTNSQDIPATQALLLPDYRLKAVKLESATLLSFTAPSDIKPLPLDINAFVYAQDGSWFVIPGDYFRADAPVRSLVDTNGNVAATYMDYNNNKTPDAGEYVDLGGNGFGTGDFADLNHNGIPNDGELEAGLRFLRYNYKINFTGAIVENKTAPVEGVVSEWMDKWANYERAATGNSTTEKFRFIGYTYDPSIAKGFTGSQDLRVPQSDDLLYEQ